jgi:excisionase family DNA binding protein
MSHTPPLAVTIPETRRLLSVGSTKVYELINDRTIEAITIGKRRLVVYESLVKFIDASRSLPSDTPANWTPPSPRRRRAA